MTVSFGPIAGTGSNVSIMASHVVASRYVNTTGDTVIVDTVLLKSVTSLGLAGSAQMGLYRDAPGVPEQLMASSATLPTLALGDNAFDFSGDPLPVRPGEAIWVALLAPPGVSVDGAILAGGGVQTLNQFLSPLIDPFPLTAFTNIVLPVVISGSATYDPSTTNLRADLVALEGLAEGAANLRADLVAAEAFGGGPAALRAGLVFLEALIDIPEEGVLATDLFPTELGMTFEAVKTPTFATQVRTATSLRSTRNSLTPYPAWDFEVSFPYLPTEAVFRGTAGVPDFEEICGFFLKMRGQHGAFLFRDPLDHQARGVQQAIGGGVTTEFTFLRALGGFAEPVGQLDTDAGWTVYVDGVAVDPVHLTFTAPNRFIFDVAPDAAAVITADFDFFFVCHFLTDAADFNQFNRDLYELRQVRFRADPA